MRDNVVEFICKKIDEIFKFLNKLKKLNCLIYNCNINLKKF